MTWKIFLTFIKYLPEFIELAKSLAAKIDKGIEDASIRRAFSEIDKAFKVEDPADSARALNDIFRGR